MWGQCGATRLHEALAAAEDSLRVEGLGFRVRVRTVPDKLENGLSTHMTTAVCKHGNSPLKALDPAVVAPIITLTRTVCTAL